MVTRNKLNEAKELWESGVADLCVPSSEYAGSTALLQTINRGYSEFAKWLIKIGVHLEWKGSGGKTALIRAVELGKTDMVAALIEGGADVHNADDKGKTAADYAAMRRQSEIAELLKNAPIAVDAVENKVSEIPANLGEVNEYGETPFLAALADRNTEFALIRKLAEAGSDVNARDYQGNSCLHFAVAGGNFQRVRLLLEFGADPNVKNHAGFSPYELAASQNMKAITDLMEGVQ
jgi:ankyrin repeat protein